MTAVVAASVFGLALNNGTYGLIGRDAVAVALWWIVALGVGLSLMPRERPTAAALAIGVMLLGLSVLTLLSTAWSDSAEKAFNEFNRVTLYLGVFALVVIGARRGSTSRWSDGLALGIVSVALVALASRLLPEVMPGSSVGQYLPGVESRLSYPVGYWNGLAILVGLAFPLLIRAALALRTKIGRGAALAALPALASTIYLTSSRGGAATALLGLALFVALTDNRVAAGAAVLWSAAGSALAIGVLNARPQLVDGPLGSSVAVAQGRSAALLILVLCVVTGFGWAFGSRLTLRRFHVRPAARVALAAAAVLAVVAGAVVADPAERLRSFKRAPGTGAQHRQQGFTNAHLLSGTGSGRWQFWQAAVREFESRPVLGRGAGSYEAWWAQHGTIAYFVRDAHSLYLETLGELGVGGFILVVVIFGFAVAVGVHRLRAARGAGRATTAALLASLLAFVFAAGVDWTWELTVVPVVGLACMALLAGPASAAPPRRAAPRDSAPGRSARFRTGARAAIVILGLGVIVAQAIPMLAQAKLRASQKAARSGDGRAAARAALAARALQPWASSPHLQLALVEEEAGDLGSARTSVVRAIDRDRSDWRLWLASARIETKLGRIDAARQSLRRARTLNPRSPLFTAR